MNENGIHNEFDKKNNVNKYLILIIIVLAVLLIVFGVFLFLGKDSNTSSNNEEHVNDTNDKKNSNQNNEQESVENNLSFVKLTDELLDKDSNIRKEVKDDFTELYINNIKVFESGPFTEIDELYSIDDKYLIVVSGSDVRTTHYHLYDKQGNHLQEIYELNDNGMVISGGYIPPKEIVFKDNIIEVDGTRLTHGPSLVLDNQKQFNLCDSTEIKNANVSDDYIVEAKYQLVYANGTIQINMVQGSELKLKDAINKYC